MIVTEATRENVRLIYNCARLTKQGLYAQLWGNIQFKSKLLNDCDVKLELEG